MPYSYGVLAVLKIVDEIWFLIVVVVIIAVLIVGAYLWGIDQLIRPFVRNVLL